VLSTKSKWAVLLAVVLLVAVAVAGCGGNSDAGKAPEKPQGADSQPASQAQTVALNGAGASFPYPLYSKWIEQYRKVASNVTIDYQSIGSGGGIKGITDQTVDFAGSDAPMKDEQLAKAPGQIFHIPTVMGAVVVTYNLEGVKTGRRP